MKHILFALLPLLASQTAQALEVGEIVRVDRSQIQCTEGTGTRPCRPHGYGYCDDVPADALVQINAVVDGVHNLTANVATCSVLNSVLDAVGNPAPMEVTQINTQKFSGGLIMKYITLSVGPAPASQIVFHGSTTL